MLGRTLLLMAALLVVPSTAVVAQTATSTSLEEAQQRVEAVAEELDAAKSRAEDARLELDRVEQRLAEAEEAVNEVARELQHQRERVDRAAKRLEQLEARAREIRRAFENRAVSLFKSGGTPSLELLLASGDVQEAVDRSAYVRVLTSGQTATLESVETSRVAVAEQRRFLKAEREHLEEMKREREALLARVEQVRDDKAVRLASTRNEVEELHAHKEDLEAEAARIEELIEQRQESAGAVGLPSTSGYIWPACGTVTSGYGYRWGRLHAGIDIDDPPSGIRAAKGGVVIYVGYRGGYGRMTMIDHGDGVVTAYAHQSEQYVGEGQRVARGEAIGVIGATGSVTGSHLHFETRVGGSAVDPRRFLAGGRC